MLRKLFNMYSIQKNGNKILNLRQLNLFLKDFGFFLDNSFMKKLDNITLELIYKKKATKKFCDFKTFIEILFSMCKNKQDQKKISNDESFKIMLDQMILPIYKDLSIKVFGFNLSKIQVFYQHYEDVENPVALLLYQNDDFLKHVDSFEILI